jgi:hypothetical protein
MKIRHRDIQIETPGKLPSDGRRRQLPLLYTGNNNIYLPMETGAQNKRNDLNARLYPKKSSNLLDRSDEYAAAMKVGIPVRSKPILQSNRCGGRSLGAQRLAFGALVQLLRFRRQ